MAGEAELLRQTMDAATAAHDRHSLDLTEVYRGVERLEQQDKNNPRQLTADLGTLNGRLHALGMLDGFELTGTDGSGHLTAVRDGDGGRKVAIVASNINDVFEPHKSSHSWLQGLENVAGSVGSGAWNEVTHHFGRVAASGAAGLGIGIGLGLLAPEVAVTAGVIGLGVGAYELATHAGKWIHDAGVVANPDAYSATEDRQAEQGLQSFGGGAVDVGAGLAGGIAGARIASSGIVGSLKDAIFNRPAAPVAADAGQTGEGALGQAGENVADRLPPAGPPERTEIPGLQTGSDQFSIRATIAGDPRAYFRAELPGNGVVEVTDIYRGQLPPGQGGDFLARSLEAHNAVPTRSLVFKGIINQPTLNAFAAGEDPANTVLGRTGARALELLGLRAQSYAFQVVNGKLNLVIAVGR